MRRRSIAGVVAIAVLLLGAGCSDDDDDGGDATTTTEAAAEPAGEAVTVSAINYGYEGLPDSVEAGTQLALQNDSTDEAHEMVVFLLPEGEERSATELFALPQADFAAVFAGALEPVMVLVAGPGEAGFPAVGDGTVAEAGRYIVGCFIPVGIDPAVYFEAVQNSAGEGPPEMPEGSGPPHTTQGMIGEFTAG